MKKSRNTIKKNKKQNSLINKLYKFKKNMKLLPKIILSSNKKEKVCKEDKMSQKIQEKLKTKLFKK